MASSANTRVSLAKVAEYVETLTLDPKSRVFVPLSEIYRQAGMLDAAQSVLLKGIRQNPDYGPAFIALGRTLVARGMTEKAEKSFRKAVQLEPENLPALKGLLRLLWKKGDAAAARKIAEAVYEVKPGDSDAEQILQRLAKRDEAESTQAAAGNRGSAGGDGAEKNEGEEPIKTATLADIYVRQGLFEKALNVYRQILGRDPRNLDIKRKALAVKKRLEEQKAQEMGMKASEPDEQTEAAGGDADDQAAYAARAAGAETESGAEPSAEAVIRTLEGWLDSIRQRRAHVQ